jgi:DNA-binding CsgD family transcriptional regulator
VDLTDEDVIPIYMKISEKVLHLRRLGITYASIAERLGINLWMAKKAARWSKIHHSL